MSTMFPRLRAARQRPARRLTQATLLALLLAVFAAAGCSGSAESPPTTADGLGLTFTTADGVTLSGRVFGSGPLGIVMAHMYPADQTSWFSYAPELAHEGYQVLTFDFRGYGDSGGSKEIDKLDRDVEAAIDQIRSLGAEEIVLVGASMGGTASLIAATRRTVEGIVCLSAPVAFRGLDARSALPKLRVPMLFLAAEQDVGAQEARMLAGLARGPAQVVLYPGSDHGTALLNGPHKTEVENRIGDFLGVVFST